MNSRRYSQRQTKVDEGHRRKQIHRFLKGFFGEPVSDTDLDIIVKKWNETTLNLPLDDFLRTNHSVWPKGFKEKNKRF
jgi:hypothetical protein